MKFFISHSSQNKPTIKAIISRMPLNIQTWMDEEKLVWGSNLYPTFESAIKEQSDYVILFVSESSAKSEWVQKEIAWALDKERQTHRTILLPVCIQSGEENCMALFPGFSSKKVLVLNSFDELGITSFAQEFSNYLFSFICSELNEVYAPSKTNVLRTINNADDIINRYSQKIREIVFYHREDNPITVDEIFNRINCDSEDAMSKDQFDFILGQISQRCLIPGLYFDGYEMYLEEEHMAWKKEMASKEKKAVAKKAAQLIKNGMKIYLDAGSTIEEMVKIICNRIQSNNLHNVTFVTISISHANAIAECCVEKGFDDTNSSIRLELVGGFLRQNTEATVPLKESEKLSDQYDSFDIAFLGANGASQEGFTVLENTEYKRKTEAFQLAKKRVVLCDASKCGIRLKASLARKDQDFTAIMNDAPSNEQFIKVKEALGDKIVLA